MKEINFEKLKEKGTNTATRDYKYCSIDNAFNIVLACMGSTFRTITVTIELEGLNGIVFPNVSIYYLLLPEGSREPSIDEIINYDNLESLTDGTSARGIIVKNIKCGEKTKLNLKGRCGITTYPMEAGIVDGYNYAIYMVAMFDDGKTTEIFKWDNPVMGMPFKSGKGTKKRPYTIGELSLRELKKYPDLLPKHPLNKTGIAETARMLDNIERLAVLYDETKGIHGMGNSLKCAYVLNTDIDLSAYATANNNSGWRPIGNIDYNSYNTELSGMHYFSGSLVGKGKGVSITGLVINRSDSKTEYVRTQGLFGGIKEAVISNISILNAKIDVGFDYLRDKAQVGTLAGYAYGSHINNVFIKNTIITLYSDMDKDYSVYAGGLIGACKGEIRIDDVKIALVVITESLAVCSNIGGLIGKINEGSIQDVDINGVYLNGAYNIGGCIGIIDRGLKKVKRINIDNACIICHIKNGGGFAGEIKSFIPSKYEEIQIRKAYVNNSKTNSDNIGAFAGGIWAFKQTEIDECSIDEGEIYSKDGHGLFIGEAMYNNRAVIINNSYVNIGINVIK